MSPNARRRRIALELTVGFLATFLSAVGTANAVTPRDLRAGHYRSTWTISLTTGP